MIIKELEGFEKTMETSSLHEMIRCIRKFFVPQDIHHVTFTLFLEY